MDATFEGTTQVSTSRTDERMAGASVGLVVATAAGLIGVASNAPFLLIGLPAAGIAGWILGPRVRRAGRTSAGVIMGVLTVIVADTIVVVGAGFGSIASSGRSEQDLLSTLAGGLAIWGLGLVFVGLPMLAITIPSGLVWSHLVRRVVERPGCDG